MGGWGRLCGRFRTPHSTFDQSRRKNLNLQPLTRVPYQLQPWLSWNILPGTLLPCCCCHLPFCTNSRAHQGAVAVAALWVPVPSGRLRGMAGRMPPPVQARQLHRGGFRGQGSALILG